MGRPKLARRAIHATIRRHRKLKKLSMKQLAEKLGVSRSVVWRWESEGYAPSMGRLARLASVLGVDASELLEDLAP